MDAIHWPPGARTSRGNAHSKLHEVSRRQPDHFSRSLAEGFEHRGGRERRSQSVCRLDEIHVAGAHARRPVDDGANKFHMEAPPDLAGSGGATIAPSYL